MSIPRRAAPCFGQPDYRLYELNKRLQQRTEESDNLWWDAFATEFFEDDATLTLTFCLEDGLKRYSKFYGFLTKHCNFNSSLEKFSFILSCLSLTVCYLRALAKF